MPILPIDTGRYGSAEIRQVFDEEMRLQKMLDVEAALAWAAFFFEGFINSRAKVFNTFVENAVQNEQTTVVSDSPSIASAFCTGVSAGTFVVGLVSNRR